MTDIPWDDIMAMEKAGGYLRRTDASPVNTSPLLDVVDVREAAAKEIAERDETIEELTALYTRLGDLLRDIAFVLRGEPPELTSWGYTGLDQLAAELIVERQAIVDKYNSLVDTCNETEQTLRKVIIERDMLRITGPGPHGPRVEDI